MTVFAPTLRSRPFGHRHLRAGQIVLIGLATWLLPALLGGVLVVAGTLLPGSEGPGDSVGEIIMGLGGLLLFAPLYGIMAVPAALIVGTIALRVGYAGWSIALGLPLLVAALLCVLILASGSPASELIVVWVLGGIVLIHALTLWVSTRLIAPDALLP
jgi:hypothetical protein